MELLKTTENRPYKVKDNYRESNLEFLRDFCCVYIGIDLKCEMYLNGEVKKELGLKKLKGIMANLIKQKEKRRRNKENDRRLVIWVNQLNLFFTYVQFLGKDLKVNKFSKFVEGKNEILIDSVYNKDLEFRNFDLIAGESVREVNLTYSFKENSMLNVMVDFLKMRQEQGLKTWVELRYTFANNCNKLFYREFSEEDLKLMKYESIKRRPSLSLSQFIDAAPKGGVIYHNSINLKQMRHNVYSYDINSAYDAQFVLGNDFPIGRVYKVDLAELPNLIKEDKWFVLVMASNYEISEMPKWLKPYEYNGEFYYIFGNYDYKCLKLMGAKITTIDKNWRKHALYTCEETGYLNNAFRAKLVDIYNTRQYLKQIGDPKEKILKSQSKFIYGKGLQKRSFESNDQIMKYHHYATSYVNQLVAFHALQRNRYELILMLDRLDYVYNSTDTDCIKSENPMAPQKFEERNKEIKELLAAAGFPDTKIGLWKFEGLYPNFIQYANKVYAYQTRENKIECKFAGCLQEAWQDYFNGLTLEEGLAILESGNVKIPQGCVRHSLQIDKDGFFIKTTSLAYSVDGNDEEEN